MIRLSGILNQASSFDLSPDSNLIATSFGYVVKVQETKNLTTITEFNFEDETSLVRFSEDSQKLLVLSKDKTKVWARAVYDPSFTVKIEDDELQIVNAIWIPDSTQIMTFSDSGIKATIYNLSDDKQYILKSPKSSDNCFSFSKSKRFLAIAEKRQNEDFIGIYYCQNWQLMNYFMIPTTDLADIMWAENDQFLLAWDAGYSYKLFAYLPTQQLLFKDENVELLGISSVKISKDNQYLALTTYDQRIVIYNCVTWSKIIEFDPSEIEETDSTKYYKEDVDTMAVSNSLLKNDDPKKFVQVIRTKPKAKQVDKTKFLRCFLEWSDSEEFLAIKLDTYPEVLFILEMNMLTLHSMIITTKEIRDVRFKGNMLFFVWGSPHFGIWSKKTLAIANPFFGTKSFRCSKIVWSKDARQMVIKSKTELCLYYPNDDFRPYLLPQKPLPQLPLSRPLPQASSPGDCSPPASPSRSEQFNARVTVSPLSTSALLSSYDARLH